MGAAVAAVILGTAVPATSSFAQTACEVADKRGTPFNRAAYDAEAKREAEAAAKKAAEKKKQVEQLQPVKQ